MAKHLVFSLFLHERSAGLKSLVNCWNYLDDFISLIKEDKGNNLFRNS